MKRGLCPVLVISLALGNVFAADWPMGGRDATRNPVSPEKDPPTDWQIETPERQPRNIRWSAPVGNWAIGGPIVADGLVWIGTNNSDPLDPKVVGDRGVLACFRESDGKFLYQYAAPRLDPYVTDWPGQSLSGSPLIEGDRLWFRSNRSEVICLDIGPLKKGTGKPVEVWKVDLIKEHGVFPRALMIPGSDYHGSIAGYKDFIYLHTLNGLADDGRTVVAPGAPSLVCLRKDTGKAVWKDASPGKTMLFGQYSSPLVLEIDGTPQVIAPQGDGWVRSFDARTGQWLWKFDLNRKQAKGSNNRPAYGVATPVFADGRVYVAQGRHPEDCYADGRLCCLDPRRRGEISSEIADDKGLVRPNPNSSLHWEFAAPANKDGKGMQLTMSPVAVSAGLVIAPDAYGHVHCLDAKTGKWHWTEDLKSSIFGAPLIVDGKIYAGTEDGDLFVLELGPRKKQIARHEFGRSITTGPIFANGTLYVLTDGRLYAVGSRK